jgi:hypothetical protein
MRRVTSIVFALALAMPLAAWAQSKPDFSGSWTVNAEKSDPPPQRGGGGGAGGGGGRAAGGGGGGRMGGGPAGPITIKQTATDLAITTDGRNGPVTSTYKLDGTESSNEMPGRGGASMTVKSTAKWDGSKIVIATTRDMGGDPVTITETRSLSADGKEMTVESSTPMGSRKVVYTKGS